MVPPMERIEEHNKRARYAKVIGRIEGHYESEKVPFGRVYRWCTECLVAECECGERMTLTCSITTCPGCGTNYAAIVQEWSLTDRAARADEALLHPWRQASDRDKSQALPS